MNRRRHRSTIQWMCAFLALGSWLCSGPAPAAAARPATGCTSEKPVRPRATFPNGRAFRLELARTPEERARGYMFREKVGREEGMLFLFDRTDFHPFWMKNCRVPLDLIWLDEEFRVVHLELEVPPCSADPCPGYFPMSKARYALEVRSGMAGKSGLRIGDPIRVEGIPPGPP